MAYNFPSGPNEGQTFTPPGGPTYVWYAPRWMMQTLPPEPPPVSALYVLSTLDPPPKLTVSTTAPPSPEGNDLWVDTTEE